MKLPGYEFGSIDLQLDEFAQLITQVINLGKYQVPSVTTAPTWEGTKGEEVYVMPSSGGTTKYVMRNTAWVALISVTV